MKVSVTPAPWRRDDDTLEDLDTGARAFHDLDVDLDRVTGAERGDVGLHRRLSSSSKRCMVLRFLRRCHRSSTDRWCSCLMVRVAGPRAGDRAPLWQGPCERRWTQGSMVPEGAVPTKSTPRHTVGRWRSILAGPSRSPASCCWPSPWPRMPWETPECAGHRGGRRSGGPPTRRGRPRHHQRGALPVVVDHVVVPDVHDRRRDDRPADRGPQCVALGDAGDARGSCLSSRSSCSPAPCHRRGSPSSRSWDPRREHDERTHPHLSADLRGSSGEHGQYEAALSLGMTRAQAIAEIIHRRVPEALIPGSTRSAPRAW